MVSGWLAIQDVDLRVTQQSAHALDVNRPVHALQRRERGAADQLIGILQQSLQRGLHLGGVEARQRVDDVHARDRILALHAPDQLRDRGLVGDLADDPKQRGLLVRLLRVGGVQQLAHREARLLAGDHLEDRGLGDARRVERLEQHVRRVVAAAGECPGDARNHPRAALDEPAHELRKGLLADERAEHLHECQGGRLVRLGERSEDRFDGSRTDLFQARDGFLGGRVRRIGR
jgi:hypothetical protein